MIAALLLFAVPQVPSLFLRETVALEELEATVPNVALHCDEDVSVAAWSTSAGVRVRASDGRGLEWSEPRELPLDGSGAALGFPATALVGEWLFAGWERELHGGVGRALLLRGFDVLAGTTLPELTLEVPGLGRDDFAELLQVAAARTSTGVRAFALVSVFGPPESERRLLLFRTLDDGARLAPPLELDATEALDIRFSSARMAVSGDRLAVAWARPAALPGPVPELGGVDVVARVSSDGGCTLAEAAVLAANENGVEQIRIDVSGKGEDRALVAWNEQTDFGVGLFDYAIRATIAAEAGAGFGPAATLATQTGVNLGALRLAEARLLAGSAKAVLTWELALLNKIGPSPVQLAVQATGDDGATWGLAATLALEFGARFFARGSLLGSGPGRERVQALWTRGAGSGQASGPAFASSSFDGGATWPTETRLNGDLVEGAAGAWSSRYQNLITALKLPGPVVRSTGFRPQTMFPSGFTAGPSSLTAFFEHFDDGQPVGWLLLSTATGGVALPQPDGRLSGLSAGGLLDLSVGFALGGSFAASLDAAGAGATTPLSVNLPPGFSFYAVGVSVDPVRLAFGDVTDLLPLPL